MGTTMRLFRFNTAEHGWREANRQYESARGQADTRTALIAEVRMERYASELRKLGATRTRDGWMLS